MNVQSVPVHFSVHVAEEPQMHVAPALQSFRAEPGPQAATAKRVRREKTASNHATRRIDSVLFRR
jgi:hypothetical protein